MDLSPFSTLMPSRQVTARATGVGKKRGQQLVHVKDPESVFDRLIAAAASAMAQLLLKGNVCEECPARPDTHHSHRDLHGTGRSGPVQRRRRNQNHVRNTSHPQRAGTWRNDLR